MEVRLPIPVKTSRYLEVTSPVICYLLYRSLLTCNNPCNIYVLILPPFFCKCCRIEIDQLLGVTGQKPLNLWMFRRVTLTPSVLRNLSKYSVRFCSQNVHIFSVLTIDEFDAFSKPNGVNKRSYSAKLLSGLPRLVRVRISISLPCTTTATISSKPTIMILPLGLIIGSNSITSCLSCTEWCSYMHIYVLANSPTDGA